MSFPHSRKDAAAIAAAFSFLLLSEGLAVGALVHSGVGLMGTHQNTIQGAVVLILTVVAALLNGTFDGFVGMTIHFLSPPSFGFSTSMALKN